jgi:hypothetical protein
LARTHSGRVRPPASWPEAQDVRTEMYRQGAVIEDLKDLTDDGIAAVFERVDHDVDLAATALTMRPRPSWVRDLVGKERC